MPSEEIERLRSSIASRGLKRRHFARKIVIDEATYASATRLHPGDEIVKEINAFSWHHGIYVGDGMVRLWGSDGV